MKSTNVTVELLKGIRSDIQSTNSRLDATREELSQRLDATREELSERIDRLTHRVVESELRTATAITDLAGTVRELTGVLRESSDLRPRVEKCEQDIAKLEKRLPAA